MTAILVMLFVFFGILVVHPFVIYPTSLKILDYFKRSRNLARTDGPHLADPPSYSLCVAAYNEEASIEGKLENLLELAARRPGTEVLLYVDGATDGTSAIVARYANRVRVVDSTVRRGKSHGMKVLVGLARNDVLVFTDANVIVDPDALDRLSPRFADPAVGLVCGHLRYVNARESDTARTGADYWRLEERIKDLESRHGIVIGADGSFFAVRRDLYRAPPDDIIDDFYVAMKVLCGGHKVVRAPDVLAWERSATRGGDEFRRKVRIACQAYNVHRLIRPELRALPAPARYAYVSHKLVRWFAGFFALGMAATAAALLAVVLGAGPALLLVAAGIVGSSLAAWAGIPPFGRVAQVLLAFAATALGVLRSIRGDRYQTWTPAESVRGAKG